MPHKILVLLGSTRADRICPGIAQWVISIIPGSADLDPEIVDLREWHLPMDDERGLPARDRYEQPHTRAWSEKVAAADGFIFVSPQYNWGYPAPLKNALDHLYKEWAGKPAAIITYGFHGGDKCAGALRLVLQGLKISPAATMPGLVLPAELRLPESRFGDPATVFATQAADVARAIDELIGLLGTEALPAKP